MRGERVLRQGRGAGTNTLSGMIIGEETSGEDLYPDFMCELVLYDSYLKSKWATP